MKIKRYKFILVVIALAFLLTACSPVAFLRPDSAPAVPTSDQTVTEGAITTSNEGALQNLQDTFGGMTSTDLRARPEQIAVTVTSSPQTSLFVTFTTICPTVIQAGIMVAPRGGGQVLRFGAALSHIHTVPAESTHSHLQSFDPAVATQTVGGLTKTYWVVELNFLTPDTRYDYVAVSVTEDEEHFSRFRTFRTIPAKNTTGEFQFIYMADAQIESGSNENNGWAFTTTTHRAFETAPDASFVYFAGDLTNTCRIDQWEGFFNQPMRNAEGVNRRLYNDQFTNRVSDFTIAATRGNHDYNEFMGHLTFENLSNNNLHVYSFSAGPMRFIVLNNAINGTFTTRQIEFLHAEVACAKAAGQWTAVAFHKGLYSGGSHVTGAEAISIRRRYSAMFAELDVDMVLNGHDHAFSRGQVRADGFPAGWIDGQEWAPRHAKLGERTYEDDNQPNAPLYFVLTPSGAIRHYNTREGYTVGSNDPKAPDYWFLDRMSARAEGHPQNPYGPETGPPLIPEGGSQIYNVKTFPTFSVVTVNENSIRFQTYMYQYVAAYFQVGELFLFDDFTLHRNRA